MMWLTRFDKTLDFVQRFLHGNSGNFHAEGFNFSGNFFVRRAAHQNARHRIKQQKTAGADENQRDQTR